MEIVGRVTQDAVVKQLKNERQVVNFTVAINDYFKPKGASEGKQTTLFINCSYWISTKVAERIKKGALIECGGRLFVSTYNDMKGEARASLNCHVNTIKVHGKTSSTTQQLSVEEIKEPLEDLPF